jgi:hypothetical protein
MIAYRRLSCQRSLPGEVRKQFRRLFTLAAAKLGLVVLGIVVLALVIGGLFLRSSCAERVSKGSRARSAA